MFAKNGELPFAKTKGELPFAKTKGELPFAFASFGGC
jgi:hypothetical protein